MMTGQANTPSWLLPQARRGLIVLTLLVVVWALVACGRSGEDEKLHIRIHNATGADIAKFWLGAGEGAGGPRSQAYGAIADGETTRYRSRSATFGSYSNYNFITADGRRFVGSTVAKELIGTFALEPGYYTFELTMLDGEVVVTILQDETP